MFPPPIPGFGRVVPRREFLRVGSGLAISGALAQGWAAESPPGSSAEGSTRAEAPSPRRARSCILVYLLGGPPQLDTFDMKPLAPAEVRGPFAPIATSVPGIEICEHLPRLARRAQQYALVRSVSHPNSNHTPMIYYTLTGYETERPAQDNDVRAPLRTDFPHLGSVVARFSTPHSNMPPFVAIPDVAVRSSVSGEFQRARTPLRGGNAGFLGPAFDPLSVNGPPGTRESIPALALPDDISAERQAARMAILAALDRPAVPELSSESFAALRRRAVALTGATGAGGRPLFSLEGEPQQVRASYGAHRFGQALLLARRLVEAGVALVAIHFNEMTVCDGWDTHAKNFEALQNELLPMLDEGLAALMDDLQARGLLDETLIVCQGEFGRTPKINAQAGRDHWGDCSTTLLAGGGIRGGQVLGASDRFAAYPTDHRVDPVDIQATIYERLGLSPAIVMHDAVGRPYPISAGRVLRELL